MPNFFNNKKGQAPLSEYALIFSLILAMLLAMGVFFRRAIQARLFDARTGMVQTVKTEAGDGLVGNLMYEYEPYYLETSSSTQRSSNTQQELLTSATTTNGIFKKSINESSSVDTESKTLPPVDAK